MNFFSEKLRTKIANWVYQILWFGFHSRRTKPNLSIGSVTMERYLELCIPRFQKQMDLAKSIAKSFNVKLLLLIGDSNSGVFNSFYAAIMFKAVTITLGIPGTRPDQWAKFFLSEPARNLLYEIQKISHSEIYPFNASSKQDITEITKNVILHSALKNSKGIMVWNIGGNSVLQKSMTNAKIALQALREMFPFSFNILIPPIHSWILDKVPNDIDYDQDIETINSYIVNEWQTQAINLRPIFKNPLTGDSWYGYLSDPVHYSRKGKRIISRTLNWILRLL
jgi:hypothetical protein